MPTHLAPDEMLADYARGATSPGLSLLVAAHLTQAPEARRRVRALERVGGVVLRDEDPVEMGPCALDRVMAAISAEPVPGAAGPDAGHRPGHAPGPLPRPVIERQGVAFGDIRWRFRLPGISEYPLDGFDGEQVSLVRAMPGSAVPQHTHRGVEVTLVMQGIMLDQKVEYRAGDVSCNDESDEHRPTILGHETCYCLTVLQGGPRRFTGAFARLLNLLSR